MPVYFCAVSAKGHDPSAYALIEEKTVPDEARPRYAVLEIGRLDGDDPVEQLKGRFAQDDNLVGRVIVVAQGGRRAAERFHDVGLSVVPVDTRPAASRDGDVLMVPEQTVVDTFETVFRRRRVDVPVESELVDSAIRALYVASSDDAGADDIPEHLSAAVVGEEEPTEPDAAPDAARQSGRQVNVSTARVADDRRPRDLQPMSKAEVTPERVGDVDSRFEASPPVDMGEDHETAMALALAVWYGEIAADEIPTTDQAGESRRARDIRRARQSAARARQR